MQYTYTNPNGFKTVFEDIDDRILKHLNQSHCKYLFHDEIGDLILISKSGATFLNDEKTISCQFVSKAHFVKAQKLGLTEKEWGTDDGLHTFDSDIENLDKILEIGEFKRRPDINSKWTNDMIRRLSINHIEPFSKPSLLKEKMHVFKVQIKEQDDTVASIKAKTHAQARYVYKKEIAKVDKFSDMGNLSVRKVKDNPNILEDEFIPFAENNCINISSK
jgi:hypothetical protein